MSIETIIIILLVILLVLIFYLALTFKGKAEIEQERRLKESLEDAFIIDPETGAKLTLEQAESGHWVSHDNEFRTIPESELKLLATDDQVNVERALNYLRESRLYLRYNMTGAQEAILERTNMISNYDDWSYSDVYQFDKGIVFLPAPEIREPRYYQESNVMFWIGIESINGHYFFREKSSREKFLDLLRNDDELTLSNYECFTLKKSYSILKINQLLRYFENQKHLEIEIDHDQLFIKTTRLVSLKDIKRIEAIVSKIV